MAPELLVISPHLDDAVLSLGRVLAGHPGSTVMTAFAGWPLEGLLSAYDASCGFPSSREAMTARRAENTRALSVLDAMPYNATFLDGQYGVPTSEDELKTWLSPAIVGYDIVIGPLGLGHHDHRVVATAARAAASEQNIPLFLYEELPYRVRVPEEAHTVLDELRADGATLTLCHLDEGPVWVKDAAVACYRSQVADPAVRACLNVPERIWRWTP